MTESERREIVEGFNQTQQDYRLDVCFHQLFEQQVERVPDRVAVVFGQQKLSYLALNGAANRLAHYLRARGVTANDRVGLLLERSAEMIVALLGILKAGGAYVPLHPDLPQARLAHQMTETQVVILVTQQSLLERLPGFAGQAFCIDRDQALLASEPAVNPSPVAGPQDLIYVIFTSGSTGVPKGVATRHENVVNYTQSICRILKVDDGPEFSFANVSPLNADLGNTNIFAALASGGTLHMIEDEVLMDGQLYGQRAADLLEAGPIDFLKIAPSHLRALLSTGEAAKVLPRKCLVVGGERLSWELVRQIQQAGGCRIVNHYSPTETTIGALTFEVRGHEEYAAYAEVVPLGRPIGNTVLYILDEECKPVPVGVAGELYIGGAGVSNGYLNRPELTAARYVADPLNPASGRRFYRSGDRARWLAGGVVEFLGREDDQVKIRGYRVELGEIEAVLSKHAGVKQAVVVLQQREAGGEALVAWVVPEQRPAPTATDLREYLRQQVPEYMVPSRIVLKDSLPLNANGKVDRRALAQPVEVSEPEAGTSAASIRNPAEETLLGIWRQVLGREDIGVEDNFFELGGHSLLATQVIARARAAFQTQVPLRSIFEAPTVAGLAGLIAQMRAESQPDDELERLMREVESLSEEEARKLLEAES